MFGVRDHHIWFKKSPYLVRTRDLAIWCKRSRIWCNISINFVHELSKFGVGTLHALWLCNYDISWNQCKTLCFSKGKAESLPIFSKLFIRLLKKSHRRRSQLFIEWSRILRKIGSRNIVPCTGHKRNYIYFCSLKPYANWNTRNSVESFLRNVTGISTC
jgi:hypothetical protein